MTPRVLCVGELLIDLCAADADVPLDQVTSFVRAPGGAPANVAVALARLGCQAGFIGAIGDDFFGAFLKRTLDDNGVDTSHLVVTRAARTTLAFVANYTDSTKHIEFYRHPGADMYLCDDAMSEAYVASFDVVHFGSISLIDEQPRAATLRARNLAAANGKMTTYDVNWRPALWPDVEAARAILLAAATGVSVVKLSDEEWEPVLGQVDFARGATRLLDAGARLVVRTEGANGATFATVRSRGLVPAFTIDAVDTLGAGDAFVAGLIRALGCWQLAHRDLDALSESDLVEAIRGAHAAAALATLKRGAMAGLPTGGEVEGFLVGQGRK